MKNFLRKYPDIFKTLCLLLLILTFSCSKYEYRTIEEPAYLRVFNCLDYLTTISNKDSPVSYLTMLIDPEFDAVGVPIGGVIVGDFMDTRRLYAPPFPNYTGNVSTSNYEYPGSADVLVAPVLNGFNLSAWAQIPSGRHRIVFVFRPRTEVPFASLGERFRKQITIDTVINLDAGEVYTLNVIQQDYKTKENAIYLRQENFHKQAFDNQRVYVNFYNLSSNGYWQAPGNEKPRIRDSFDGSTEPSLGIRDTMNIYFSLYTGDAMSTNNFSLPNRIPGYADMLWGPLIRDQENNAVHPYYSFPLILNADIISLKSPLVPSFTFARPSIDPSQDITGTPLTELLTLVCDLTMQNPTLMTRRRSQPLYNPIVTTHSGGNREQSFATINTVEVINGSVYLTSVQRTFLPPVY